MKVKVTRVKEYWDSLSMLIPNVFRVLSHIDSNTHVMEFQDLSSKVVLVQGFKTEVDETPQPIKGRTPDNTKSHSRATKQLAEVKGN